MFLMKQASSACLSSANSYHFDMTHTVSRRHLLGAAAFAPLVARAQDTAPAPIFGQPGKDVIWAPTPDAMVDRMRRLAGLRPRDFVIDLGAGDGKIVIAAAKAGARGLGIEYNPELVTLARQRAQAAGVAEHARFEKADIFESDFSRASIVTLYLLPRLNLRLRHRLLALTPGTRVVSHSFDMGDWRPDEVTNAGGATAFLWLVPANFGGEWALRFPLADGSEARGLLEVEQRFQRISGAAVFRCRRPAARVRRPHRRARADRHGDARRCARAVSRRPHRCGHPTHRRQRAGAAAPRLIFKPNRPLALVYQAPAAIKNRVFADRP